MRKPDLMIGDPNDPYMLRWYLLPRNRFFNIYLHHILHSDDDRALHDHPWPSVSLLLAGKYLEITPKGERIYNRGSLIFRSSNYSHRLELVEDQPAWTLFITGPRVREWGFHCPQGWIPWHEFTSPESYGEVGRGCGEPD